jgi:group I intron endonuclease
MTVGVYRITCVATGDSYVGSSVCIEARFSEHIYCLSRNRHSNKKFQKVCDENGVFSFSLEILRETKNARLSDLLGWELFYINELQPNLNSPHGTTALKGKLHWQKRVEQYRSNNKAS